MYVYINSELVFAMQWLVVTSETWLLLMSYAKLLILTSVISKQGA